jgi:hypothetical protein
VVAETATPSAIVHEAAYEPESRTLTTPGTGVTKVAADVVAAAETGAKELAPAISTSASATDSWLRPFNLIGSPFLRADCKPPRP